MLSSAQKRNFLALEQGFPDLNSQNSLGSGIKRTQGIH